jgi:hypothetical protein
MDDPYWYETKSYVETTSEEDLKLILEDGIPHQDMFVLDNDETRPFFLANN